MRPPFNEAHCVYRALYLLNNACYTDTALQGNRSGGRCWILISLSFGLTSKTHEFELGRQRKVRTLQGSEPANGGASSDDDKCNRK